MHHVAAKSGPACVRREALQAAIKAAVSVPAAPKKQPEPEGHTAQLMQKAVLAHDGEEVRRLVQAKGALVEAQTLVSTCWYPFRSKRDAAC